MAKKSAKPIQQQIFEHKLKIAELEDKLRTQIYLETMPEYSPSYKYCYATSNFSIPHPLQSIDNWIKAVIKHMGTRRFGHGGGKTNAVLISIPDNLSKANIDKWLSYQNEKLRSKANLNKRKN